MLPQDKWVAGTALSCSQTGDWLTHTSTELALLYCPGKAQGPSVAAGGRQEQYSNLPQALLGIGPHLSRIGILHSLALNLAGPFIPRRVKPTAVMVFYKVAMYLWDYLYIRPCHYGSFCEIFCSIHMMLAHNQINSSVCLEWSFAWQPIQNSIHISIRLSSFQRLLTNPQVKHSSLSAMIRFPCLLCYFFCRHQHRVTCVFIMHL